MTKRVAVSTENQERPSGRSLLIDLLKAVGCLLIVLHHLAFYGPMSDVVETRWPLLVDGLAEHGRLAVQLFLVCSGYLTAAAFARDPDMSASRLLRLAWRRYLRLSVPLLAALSATVLVTEWVRPGFDHPSLSATPDVFQALAHTLLSQHLFELEALSAGVWYVSIDFQLYLMAMLALWAVSRWVHCQPSRKVEVLRLQVMLLLTALSLLCWNLKSDLDIYGVYFFGSYGLGWLAWRTRQSRIPLKGLVVLVVLGGLAWIVDSRLRAMTACGVAMLLAAAPASWMRARTFADPMRRAVSGLAGISYSVFVIHFGVSLGVSALVTHWWPDSVFWNAVGMGLSLTFSVLAGALLHRWTERHPPKNRHWILWTGVFMASTGLAMNWNDGVSPQTEGVPTF